MSRVLLSLGLKDQTTHARSRVALIAQLFSEDCTGNAKVVGSN